MQEDARLVITVDGHPVVDIVPHGEIARVPAKPRPIPARVTLAEGRASDEILDELRRDRC